ncbi:MAG TPA: enoyl-CoA hydratase/isomerase family protein [Pyrinomonadaceae bacterium]|nr:enoyl-CoA hydratase/isomerase family protein [Pyrinomonadaceae bacterium]
MRCDADGTEEDDDEPQTPPVVQAPPVLLEEHDNIAVLRINRPEQRNSLSVATLLNLEQAFTSLSARADIAAVIFTGTADVFASGADIRELRTLTHDSARAFAERGQRLFQRIADARQLTIAAVNGYCMGGGLDLALACRVRVASPSAVFAHPGARLGIITGWGGTQRLPRLVGAARALEMFTTARRLTAEEALEFGLVSHIHPDALACAFQIASTIRGGL